MYETRRFELPYAGCVTCQLVRVLRDHHDSMVGDDRGRPGWDRVLLRLQSGEEVIADVWTRSGESIADAPQWIALRDDGTLFVTDFDGRVLAITPDRKTHVIATDLRSPHGLEILNGAL